LIIADIIVLKGGFNLVENIIILIIIFSLIILIVNRYSNSSLYKHLFDLEEVLNGELDFIHLSKNILLKVQKETSACAGIIYWFDEVQNEFKLKSLAGISDERINQVTRILRLQNGVLDHVQMNPNGFLIIDLKSAQNRKDLQELSKFFSSIMVIPLNMQKKVFGALILFKSKRLFKRYHLKLLRTFVPRATVRLDNARLYQLTKETATENAKLYVNISKLYQQATLDELTGLYNKNFFMQRIKEEIKKAWRFKQPLSLIFIDLDYFKKINDNYGHQIGDQLLAEFGGFIKNLIRDYDVACRFGGEEFVILLPHTKLDNAFDLAERLREKVAEHLFCSPAKNLKITASFGVSALIDLPEPPKQLNEEILDINMENLVNRADEALYQAKKAGRNHVASSLI
jgi:diguanylate cyclase (GGDEF)-like protein